MRRAKSNGGFFLCLLFNMLLNLGWLLPAVVLLILHFVLGLSIWWFVGAAAAWLIVLILWTGVFAWANRCSRYETSSAPQENKNPYSVGNSAADKFDYRD